MLSSWLSGNKQAINTTLCAIFSIGLLSGCVSMQSIKSPNETFGVAATDRTLAQRILDQSIENTAVVNISRISPELSEQSRVSVDSFYSNVLITGEVPDEEAKKKVESVVASMPDINKLYNRLTIANVKGASYTVHDGYITSKLNAKILANNAIKNSQVKVVTEDGVVYVMGKLTPAQREHLINIVNNTVGIKELVLLTDLIDNNGAIITEEDIIQEDNLEPPVADYSAESYQAATEVEVEEVPNTSQQPRTVPVTKAAESAAYQNPQSAAGSTYRAPETNGSATTNSSNSNDTINNEVAPVLPTQGSDTTYASPYIEMYKNEVKGW